MSRPSCSMVITVPDGFQWNIYLLSAIGLWPFYNTVYTTIQRAILSIILLFGFSFQLVGFIIARRALTQALRNFSYLLLSLAFILKYVSHYFLMDSVAKVTCQLSTNIQTIRRKEETAVIRKYASNGTYHTKIFSLFISPPIIGLSMLPFYTFIFDMPSSLNGSESRRLPIMYGFVFERKGYYYPVLVLICVMYLIGGVTFIATETIAIQSLQHACALWEITGQRIQRAFEISAKEDLASKKEGVRTLLSGIKMHIETLDFCEFLRNNFTQSYLLLMGIGVLSLSVHLFRVSQLLSAQEKMGEAITSLFVCTGIFGYMFYMNYVTQAVINKSSDLFIYSYNGPWYDAPLPMQKMLLMVLLRSITPFKFDLCNMYSPCNEGFSMIARASVSYFMVLQSFQSRQAQI